MSDRDPHRRGGTILGWSEGEERREKVDGGGKWSVEEERRSGRVEMELRLGRHDCVRVSGPDDLRDNEQACACTSVVEERRDADDCGTQSPPEARREREVD